MSARDSSDPAGPGNRGAGGLGNGGVGGGFGGGASGGRGGMGAGAGRNGGYDSRTGLTTGNRMYGGVAVGRPSGMAMNPGAWGIHPQPAVTSRPLNRPTVPGLLSPPIENVPVPPAATIQNPFYQPSLNNVASFLARMKQQYSVPNPSWGPVTDVYGQPIQKDLANIDWSGDPKNIQAMQGGYGATAYSNGGAGYQSWSGAPRKGDLGGGY